MLTASKIIETIRKNVKSEDETEYKKWDSLPMDVRWFLRETADCVEMQQKYIDKMECGVRSFIPDNKPTEEKFPFYGKKSR